jgi:hypothetical protein
MRRIMKCLGLAAAVLGLPLGAMGRADAASITYTAPLDSVTQPGFIPQFDPNLGTLLEVDFSATGSGGATILVNPPVTSGTYRQTWSFAFISSNTFIELPTFVDNSTFSFKTPTFFVNLGGNYDFSDSITFGLASFYGNRVFNLQIGGPGPPFFITSPPVQQSIIGSKGATAFGTATVIYIYTISAPPSAGMAGTALLAGLGYWLRRFDLGLM